MRRYVTALLAVGLLALAGQLVVQLALSHQLSDARVINIAGRQRMLSQKLAKLVVAIPLVSDPAQRAGRLDELADTADLWERSHHGLQRGDAELGLPGDNSATTAALYATIQPTHDVLLAWARDAVAVGRANQDEPPPAGRANQDQPPPAGRARSLELLLSTEAAFLSGMDRIVFQYDAESTGRVETLRRLEAGLFATLLGVLVLEALFIFRPAVQRIRAAMHRQELAQQTLRHMAFHDPLTGLPNRVLLLDRLTEAVAVSCQTNVSAALLLLDLDHFKEVNDTFGHHVGDELLRQFGARLRSTLARDSTVARLGGDEFAILLPLAGRDDALRAARAALLTLEQPFALEEQSLTLEASLGIALAPEHGNSPELLLRHADAAMYQAKRSGAGLAVYVPTQYVAGTHIRFAQRRGDQSIRLLGRASRRHRKVELLRKQRERTVDHAPGGAG